MDRALTYIAESMVKAVGVAGIEAMAMKNAIYSIWRPIADELSDAVISECFDFANDDIREEYVDAVYTRFRLRITTDFIDAALPYVEEYAGYAWDRGREDALGYAMTGLLTSQKSEERLVDHELDNYSRLFAGFLGRRDMPEEVRVRRHEVKKDQESIITDLVTLTGSTRKNVQRTIKRWFRNTQGQYFERYIIPETARLLSYDEGTTLNMIGKRYKEFVKGEAYWSGISEFNSETSKIFSQVQTLHELNITEYTIEAIIDEKTCPVCLHLNGSVWSVEEAVTKVYDMIISEADAAAEINPFPPRSTPKDFEDPKDSPYGLPPYHPRCRCNIRSTTKVTAMPQQVLAKPLVDVGRPSSTLLNKTFTQYIKRTTKSELAGIDGVRALSNAEWKVAKEAWETMPYEVKKWAGRNTDNYNLYVRTGDNITSRVVGNNIEMNAKYFDPDRYGPLPLQHELRHAIVNRHAITARGGAEEVWSEITDAVDRKKFRPPTHVNTMYQLNGSRGLQAASAASDEFLAMIGDYYEPDMSMSELINAVRNKRYGIEISDSIGTTVLSRTSRWSAKEAKSAVEYWWGVMDIDNNTLLSKKQLVARQSYKPFTKQMRTTGVNNEVNLRNAFRAAEIEEVHQTGDNKPFDVWVGADPAKYYSGASRRKPTDLIEVKTLINNTNDKITMRRSALERKLAEGEKLSKKGTRLHTIVIDERSASTKYYHREGIGSYRLSAMDEVTPEELVTRFGGKPIITELPPEQRVPEKYAVSFKKYKTVPKAEAEIKKKFGVDIVWDISDGMMAEAGMFPSKAKVRILNQLGDELTRLNNENGMYKHWTIPGDKVRHEMNATKIHLVAGYDMEGIPIRGLDNVEATGVFASDSKELYVAVMEDFEDLAGTKMGRKELVLKKRELHEAQWSIVGEESLGVLDHEIGHELHFFLDEVEYPRVNYWNNWQDIYASHTQDWWSRNVSKYGSTNAAEAFAESYAAYVHPSYGKAGNLLPKEIEEFFAGILI